MALPSFGVVPSELPPLRSPYWVMMVGRGSQVKPHVRFSTDSGKTS